MLHGKLMIKFSLEKETTEKSTNGVKYIGENIGGENYRHLPNF